MPTKKTTTGKKTGSKRSAKIGYGGDGEDPFDADPPIVVQGGNSIILDRPDKFLDHGITPHGKQYRIGNGVLVSCQINTNTPIALRPTDKISITWRQVTPKKKPKK